MDEQAQKTIDERVAKDKESLLEEIRQNSIIELACKKTGIGRTTFYRWRKEDFNFAVKVSEAIEQGRSVITDMVLSQFIKKIQEGYFPALKSWMDHHDDYFISKSTDAYQKQDETPELPKELIEEIDNLSRMNFENDCKRYIKDHPEILKDISTQ